MIGRMDTWISMTESLIALFGLMVLAVVFLSGGVRDRAFFLSLVALVATWMGWTVWAIVSDISLIAAGHRTPYPIDSFWLRTVMMVAPWSVLWMMRRTR